MYISRPPISPNKAQQLQPKNTVPIHRGKGNKTTDMVKDVDNAIRHPITQQFLSRFQNQQSVAAPLPVKTNNGK